MLVHVGVIVVATAAVFGFSHLLSSGTDTLGRRLGMNPGVRGATLDAVASSFPELCAVIIALLAGAFDAGVGTVAGSALYNVLVIPAASVFVGGSLRVQKQVVRRDGFLYVAVVAGLIAAIWFGPETVGEKTTHRLSVAEGIGGLLVYAGYVALLAWQARSPVRISQAAPAPANPAEAAPGDEPPKPFHAGRVALAVGGGVAGVGLATHFLVHSSLELFRSFGLSEAVAGVTLLAAATSLPDTLLSVFAVRRGDADGAVSNAFGSNSFDVLVCLGLPVLVVGGVEVDWAESWRVLAFLLGATVISVIFLITDWCLTRREAVVMTAVYALFVVLAFTGHL